MSALTPEQAAEVRAIVAEMIGQALNGTSERFAVRIREAQKAADAQGVAMLRPACNQKGSGHHAE